MSADMAMRIFEKLLFDIDVSLDILLLPKGGVHLPHWPILSGSLPSMQFYCRLGFFMTTLLLFAKKKYSIHPIVIMGRERICPIVSPRVRYQSPTSGVRTYSILKRNRPYQTRKLDAIFPLK
jgi:hypothetical protein